MSAPLLAFKRTPAFDERFKVIPIPDETDAFAGIRCPLCAWKPDNSSLWCCACEGTPEPPFAACFTTWNTFRTAGLCPGCNHQWKWTSCLSCQGWSHHEDWYEDKRPQP